MPELRSFALVITETGAETYEAKKLIEKAIRIKKVILAMRMPVTTTGAQGSCNLSKQAGVIENLRAGDIAHLELCDNKLTEGGTNTFENLVVDFAPDYIEVEEDDYIYLTAYCGGASILAVALIFYEE